MLRAIGLGLLLALLFASPWGQRFERDWGLSSLYALRGEVAAPTEAMVIALEQKSVNWLQFHAPNLARVAPGLAECLTPRTKARLGRLRNIGDMPRGIHACLIDLLASRGARLIVFDILFHIETEDDAVLAEAIARAGSVILFERIRVDAEQALLAGGRPIAQRVHPRMIFTAPAAGTASFLVDAPMGNFVDGYVPRLPEFPDLAALPDVAAAHWTGSPVAAEGPEARPIWLYGPPRTIPTRTLRDVFARNTAQPLPEDLSGTAVFIGVSDPEFLGTKDHFKVPISDARQNDIGGVELAATAFLNRLHGHDMTRLAGANSVAALGLFGWLLALAAGRLGGGRGVWAVLGLGGVWLAAAWVLFVKGQVWAPLAVPLFLGVPLALLFAIAARYAFARRLVESLAPRQVAGTLLDATDAARRAVKTEPATILFTDLIGSTALGDRLAPEHYGKVMNHYYERATAAVEAEGGMVVEFMGDGILAVFSQSVAGPSHARRACRAAKALSATIRAEDPVADLAERGGEALRLRMGLHTGLTATGDIGAEHRFNFKALGDTVNTAARLEQLGKALEPDGGDIILLSDATYQASGLQPDAVEAQGAFVLRGKAEAISVVRMIQGKESARM
ncbi:MAG: adenylate/guanylate cyclase domain-containing protein [Pseudomonadota bacterium]